MNSHQRGIYQPLVENIPVYDLTEDEAEDEQRSRLPLLIVIGLIVLAAFTGVVWLAYNQGVERGRSGSTVIIAPPEGPVRTPPADSTGTTPFTNLKIYSEPVPPDQEAKVSNLAPAPAPAPLPKPAVAPPAPLATTEAPPVRLNPPAPPPARIVPPPAAPAAPPPAVAQTVPAPAAAPPAARVVPPPAVAPVTPPPAVAQAVPAPRPAPAPPAVAEAAPAKPALSGFVLQLGSYQNEMLAQNGWNTFKGRFIDIASATSEDIQRVDLGARGIWYRLRIGPYADKNIAIDTCDKLKAQGGTCLVTAP